MSIEKILPNIQMIKNYSNSFVIEFKDYCILIDAGMNKKSKEIIEAIDKTGKELKAILITHGHIDHINGLAKLKEKYPNLVIASSEEDKRYIEGSKMLLPKGIKKFLFSFLSIFMRYKGVRVGKILRDGDIFEKLKVIETPGHTKGSLSFLLKIDNKNILFVGDLVINKENKMSFTPEEFNFDKGQIFDSLKKISEIKFDCLLPGHGEPILSNAKTKIKNFLESSTICL